MYMYKACINDMPYVIGFLMSFLNNFYLGSLKIASGNWVVWHCITLTLLRCHEGEFHMS